MNKLNRIELPETSETANRSSPSGTMLTTLLLLIAGFLFTSVMLTHYQIPALKNNGIKTTGNPLFPANIQQKSLSETSNQSGLFPDRSLLNHWPRLKLAGFGKSEEKSGDFAIINGKKVHLEQTIAGKVRLVEIRDHDVIVEFNGEKRILTIEN